MLDTVKWQMQWGAVRWREVLGPNRCRQPPDEHIRDATRTGQTMVCEAFVQELETRVGRRLRPRKRDPKVEPESGGSERNLVVS